jgi:uncharacterized repeat protein (TIGR03803 family)
MKTGPVRSRLLPAIALAQLILTAGGAAAPRYEAVHIFAGGGGDGAMPFAPLVVDGKGKLYGTTVLGGGSGTLFEIAPDGTETVLHGFGGADGADPDSGLIVDAAGNLFGTAEGGGGNCNCGVVFELSAKGKYSVLYRFQGGSDGAGPSSLSRDAAGNFYGTTAAGGSSACDGLGCGAVFRLAPDGTETVLYAFAGGADGQYPEAGVVVDAQGNIYGTTSEGGIVCSPETEISCGTVFKLAPNGTKTILHSFTGGDDGGIPFGGVLLDADGTLYGTTQGGFGNACKECGHGTVFKIASDGTETVLHSFAGGSDGDAPLGTLVFDKAHFYLYGTTYAGGNGGCHRSGCGTVFRTAPDGATTMLHAFRGALGINPHAGLVAGRKGYFYGTTEAGGGSCGCGVAFKFKPPK